MHNGGGEARADIDGQTFSLKFMEIRSNSGHPRVDAHRTLVVKDGEKGGASISSNSSSVYMYAIVISSCLLKVSGKLFLV